jgi:hypothetical protein
MFYLVAGLYVLPLVAVICVAKHKLVTDDGKVVDKRIDWLGGLIFTAGAVFLFTSLSQALRESRGWKTPCKLRPQTVHQVLTHLRQTD